MQLFVDDSATGCVVERFRRYGLVVSAAIPVTHGSEIILEAESAVDVGLLGGDGGADTWLTLKILRPDGEALVLAPTWRLS